MLLSRKEKIIIGIIVALIFLIPATSFVVAQRINSQKEQEEAKQKALQLPDTLTKESSSSAIKELQKNLGADNPSPSPSSGPEISFGPTLNFKNNIEGRKAGGSQAAKVFLGLAQGALTSSPQYLLTIKVDVPDSGQATGISIAGLTQGSSYTAYIKGPSQIATSSSFLVKPSTNDLGTLNMTTGDLNEDNVINDQDVNILKPALGATSSSAAWNANYDFNQDGIINNFDLAIINRNLGKVGAGGPWYSKISELPSPPPVGFENMSIGSPLQAPLASSSGSPSTSGGGYWLWIPKF